PKTTVNRANSLENRILKLLAYLQNRYPNEGWGNYVERGAPKWSSIVVSGHSQGGGHAALTARNNVVARVAMFSAPTDHVGVGRQVDSSTPPPYLLGVHQTPDDRYFGLAHI